MENVLATIIDEKYNEVRALAGAKSFAALDQAAKAASPVRGFAAALARDSADGYGLIAELKKASPSKGLIRADFDPASLAKAYEDGGASCLSVLTDRKWFQGAPEFLVAARDAVNLPVLRKDFIVDPYQIAQSKVLGADCILLIVAALGRSQMLELAAYANEISIDVLVEVHDREELEQALEVESDLIGVNNRNLHNFKTTLQTTLDLYPHVPPEKLIITESGINSVADVKLMTDNGIFGFLVGESFMRAPDPGSKLKELFFDDD